MKYKSIKIAEFVDRPNRFISNVIIDGKLETVHVKNTGRCKEILEKGIKVILEKATNPNRKTKYSLVAAYKGNTNLINIDSQITNYVVYDALQNNLIPELKDLDFLRKEVKMGNSRFDLYYEKDGKKGFIEVKSVTLEENGLAKFPDAPTERGVKHLNELNELSEHGYDNYVLFLIQIENITQFTPNSYMDLKFSNALKSAYDNGVKVLAYNCILKEDAIDINSSVKVII